MNKSELKNEMVRFLNGSRFIRKKQLADFLGVKDVNSVNQYVAGLEYVGRNFYFVDDVCQRLINEV